MTVNIEATVFALGAIATAVERAVEITKLIVPKIARLLHRKTTVLDPILGPRISFGDEYYLIHCLPPRISKVVAVLYGALIIYLGRTEVSEFTQVPVTPLIACFGGLLCSGGAGIWHDVLELVRTLQAGKSVKG